MLEGKEEFFTPEELEAKEYLNNEPLDSFYLNCLKKCPMIEEKIKSHDEAILKHLTQIESLVFEDNDNYVLKFHFSENLFFDNAILSVTVVMDEEGTAEEIKSDKVNWKEGKNVTTKSISKKQKNKRSGNSRTVTKNKKQESFFNLFTDLKDDKEDEDMDENDEEVVIDFPTNEETLEVIKDNVIPFVGASYFGVKIPELEVNPEDFEDEGEEDEDYEDEDEDEEEDKGKKPKADKKKPAKKSGDALDKADPNNQECKQN